MRHLKPIEIIKKGSKLDNFLSKRYSSSMFSYKEIFAMLGPLIIDQFFIYLIGMLTTAMISTSNQTSVTAVGLVSPVTMILYSIFSATASGGTVIVAQYRGKGDDEMLKKSASQVILITFLIAAVFSILLIVFADQVVNMFFPSAEAIVKQKSGEYVRGCCISMIPFALFNGIFSVLRGIGDTKTCLRLTVIINGLHLVGSVIFINVLKLDILGTVLSLNVARVVGCVMALYVVLSPQSQIIFNFKDFIKFNWKLQKSIIKFGIPFGVEQIFFNFGALVAQMYISKLGTVNMAANTIGTSAVHLFYGTGFAVATLAITVIGQSIGAGDVDLAKRYGKRMVELGTVVMLITIAILYPLMPFILNLYSPQPETLGIINKLVLIGVVPIPFFWSLSYVMPSNLRAAGDANFTSIACLVCMWIFRVGLGYLLVIPLGMGVYGVGISMGIEMILRAIVFAIRFKGTKWYSKKIV